MRRITVSISIDTEEDDWGSYAQEGASTRNIGQLPELQDLFDRRGARPTYLVNRPPLVDPSAVNVLGHLAARDSVEIGGHCHPWNTPPHTGGGADKSMMCSLSLEANRGKIREVGGLIRHELGVRPLSFRAGRWGFGPTVARALVDEGFTIDCSVSPFIDWSLYGGPDYSDAPHFPYRFDPSSPFRPEGSGALLQLPTTIGFLRGNHRRSAHVRRRLEKSILARLRVVGVLDRAGLLARRWLSPETSSGQTMVRLIDAWVSSGESFLQVTFHSSALLPGATPFVRDESDKRRFLRALDDVLVHCEKSGFAFRTLAEAGSDFDSAAEVA